jgi:cold shock CspA family protein
MDDRGFGFIEPAGGGAELFVHISAFPRGGNRPQVGELISFEIEAGPDGRRRAVRIMRPASRAKVSHRRPPANPERKGAWLSGLISLLMIGAIAAYGYRRYNGYHAATHPPPIHTDSRGLASVPVGCDGRTQCRQMTSCAEAKFFLANCPGTRMDGDHDGVPCEDQWCN